jgi:hypothetical protein
MTENDIASRLDEFAQTHGAVLLGMHRELTSLKSDVESQLRDTTQHLVGKLDQCTADQVGVLEHVNHQATTAVKDIETKSSRLLREAKLLNDETRKEATDSLSILHREATNLKESLIQTESDASRELDNLIRNGRALLKLKQQELDSNQAKIVTYVSIQQRLLDEQAEDLKSQRQMVFELQTQLDQKIATHQMAVDRFNATTRKVAIASVALFFGLMLWYGINQWMP